MFDKLILFSTSFFITFFCLPIIMELMKSKGIVGHDAHKKSRPLVPEMGGVAMIIGLTMSVLMGILLVPEKLDVFVSFWGTIAIAGIIGAIDDLKPLNAKVKPFLTLFACIPILLMRTYTPYIVFPIIGGTRLTIVYPILIPIVMAVTSNAVNMMDPFNGVMAGTGSIITLTLLASAIIFGSRDAIILCCMLLGALLAFFYYNRYPSRVFSGDVGSLSGSLHASDHERFLWLIHDRSLIREEGGGPTDEANGGRADESQGRPESPPHPRPVHPGAWASEGERGSIRLHGPLSHLGVPRFDHSIHDVGVQMSRRVLDFIIILLFVWIWMIGGLWFIDYWIIPLEIPGIEKAYIVNIVQVVISTVLVLLWLLLWKRLATWMFWRAIGDRRLID
jgi:hypothetical protein